MLFYTPCPVPGSGEAQSPESCLLPGSERRFGRQPRPSPSGLSSARTQGPRPAPCTNPMAWGLGFFTHRTRGWTDLATQLQPAPSGPAVHTHRAELSGSPLRILTGCLESGQLREQPPVEDGRWVELGCPLHAQPPTPRLFALILVEDSRSGLSDLLL